MSGYQWTPPKRKPDPATVIAVLRRDNERLARQNNRLRDALSATVTTTSEETH